MSKAQFYSCSDAFTAKEFRNAARKSPAMLQHAGPCMPRPEFSVCQCPFRRQHGEARQRYQLLAVISLSNSGEVAGFSIHGL